MFLTPVKYVLGGIEKPSVSLVGLAEAPGASHGRCGSRSSTASGRAPRRTSDDATATGNGDRRTLFARLGCDGLRRVRVGAVGPTFTG